MWIKTSLAALAMMGALAAATPTPILAQGVYVGPGGVGVDTADPVGVMTALTATVLTAATPKSAASEAVAAGR